MSTNDKLADALSSAVIQMDMAGDCIEAGRYNEALLHVRSLMRSRREVLAEHAASLAAPPAQGEWQPIETAPKDGTYVLLFDDDYAAKHIIAAWDIHDGAWWSRPVNGKSHIWGSATHWMPLSTPSTASPQPAPAPVQAVCNRNCDCVGECKAGVERPAAQPPAPGEAELSIYAMLDKVYEFADLPYPPPQDSKLRASIAELAQQRVPDAVREVIADMRRAVERADAGKFAIYDPSKWADQLESALAIIDQQQEGRK